MSTRESPSARVMEHGEDPVSELARGLHAYLSKHRLVRAEAMHSAAAVVDTDMRRLTDRCYAGLSQALIRLRGSTATPDACQ
jgi:hypothetical protein